MITGMYILIYISADRGGLSPRIDHGADYRGCGVAAVCQRVGVCLPLAALRALRTRVVVVLRTAWGRRRRADAYVFRGPVHRAVGLHNLVRGRATAAGGQ